MKLDLVKRIGALLAGTLLIGCGGGGSSAPLVDAASTDAAAEAARVAAAMTTTTPVNRGCYCSNHFYLPFKNIYYGNISQRASWRLLGERGPGNRKHLEGAGCNAQPARTA